MEFWYFLKSNQLYCADVRFGLRNEVFTHRPFEQGTKLVNWLTSFDIIRFPDSPIPCYVIFVKFFVLFVCCPVPFFLQRKSFLFLRNPSEGRQKQRNLFFCVEIRYSINLCHDSI